MADDDPQLNVDMDHADAIDPAVLGFLDAMKTGATGTEESDPVVRKLFEYKISLYLSVPDPNIPNAVRNKFAKWLSEFSKYRDLKGANFRVTNCRNEFIFVPSLLYDDEFQKLTGWETVKAGTTRNVHICLKLQSALSFSRLKHRMLPFLFEQNILMKRNQSLGDSAAEMATIGYLSPVHPDLLLDHIQLGLNQELQCIKAQQEEDYLLEYGVRRGVLGEIVIAHGAVRGSSKQHGDVVNTKAVIVECPKHKAGYYMKHIQEALRTFDWSPDMKKIKFVPFALKADPKTKDVFTNMLVYNSMENDKKAYAQILGVSCDDMESLRLKLIADGPNITHVEPTRLSAKQGRWRIFSNRSNLETVEKWLKEHLASLVAALSMHTPVPGFETPRLVLNSRVSQSTLQDIVAVSKTVPDLTDATTFPNLVVTRGRVSHGRGAWKHPGGISSPSPYDIPVRDKHHQPFAPPPASTAASSSLSSPAFIDISRQLEDNRKWRVTQEHTRNAEKQQHQDLREMVNLLRKELDEEKLAMKKQLDASSAVLGHLATGQSEIQRTMAARDEHHGEAFIAMRADITALTKSVRELLHIRSDPPIATPPRLQRTDPDIPLYDSDDSDSLGIHSKRPHSPNKQSPRFRKNSRFSEGMNTSDDPTTRQP